MKITLHLKDPDGVSSAIYAHVKAELDAIEGIDEDEREGIHEERADSVSDALKPWVKWGEYVTVEIDTDTRVATVVKTAE